MENCGAPELEGERTVRMYQDYAATRASGRHVEMRAGDRTSLAGGVEITAISSNAQPITKPLDLPGAGKGNPLCGEFVATATRQHDGCQPDG